MYLTYVNYVSEIYLSPLGHTLLQVTQRCIHLGIPSSACSVQVVYLPGYGLGSCSVLHVCSGRRFVGLFVSLLLSVIFIRFVRMMMLRSFHICTVALIDA